MAKKLILSWACLCVCLWLFGGDLAPACRGAEPLQILPEGADYDPAIPSPQEFFGFSIGSRHLFHHQLVAYCRRLAELSDRVTVQEYARSYGGRPLILCMISSAENQRRLEQIRERRAALCDPGQADSVDIDSLPALINMGYSIHGNEPSGGNAAMLVAYHLAAARGDAQRALLEETVIALDPCLNPDGFERFAQWANNHRGRVLNSDPNHREHREPTPSGRTNYYWFDLNRDWLPVQHPESQGRLEMFYKWRPNVVLDFHEMGTNSTYFFQPGVPKRNHPLTPQATIALTNEFGRYHARALDAIGSLYYSEEGFDDFYMGKGSTYPDLHGAVGILFEQASARGHVQESDNGELTFSFAIRNHFATSMSSLQATFDHRVRLQEHLRTFYRDAESLARNSGTQGYLLTAPGDRSRLHRFLEVLGRHQIQAFRLAQDWVVEGRTFHRDESFVIPVRQPEFRFLEALFERRTVFEENIFYDVSTWTLPLAFHILHAKVSEPIPDDRLGAPFSAGEPAEREIADIPEELAYVVDWRGYDAPRLLHQLLAADVKVKVASEPFEIEGSAERIRCDHGSLLVPLGIQPEKRAEIGSLVRQAAGYGVRVHEVSSGLTPEGVDFGSNEFARVPQPKVLLVTGEGTNSYEAGEAWHLFDQRVQMPVTLVTGPQLAQIRLSNYSVLILVSGGYSSISPAGAERLKEFVSQGGTLIAIGTAIRWIDRQKVAHVRFRTASESVSNDDQSAPRRPYAEAAQDAAYRLVRGSIFKTHVDTTHPVGYGLTAATELPVFRNNNVFLEPSRNAYSTPVIYDRAPLLSGYVSPENLDLLAESASVVVQSSGRGRLILFAENPNFRAFWLATNRLFLNAVFFGPLVQTP